MTSEILSEVIKVLVENTYFASKENISEEIVRLSQFKLYGLV